MIPESILERAIAMAKSSTFHKKVGALLLSNQSIVAWGTNIKKTHPVQAKWAIRAGLPEKIYLHAEMSALIRLRSAADTIVVARVNSQGKLRNAKPCPICRLALEEIGIKQICYTVNEGFMYEFN